MSSAFEYHESHVSNIVFPPPAWDWEYMWALYRDWENEAIDVRNKIKTVFKMSEP